MDTEKRAILDALEEKKGIVTDACASIGLARSTYYSWLNSNDEEFKNAVAEIQEVALDYVEGKLFQRIEGLQAVKYTEKGDVVYEIPPDTTAIIFYLKTKGKKRGYVERTEHTGKDGESLFNAQDLTNEQLAIIAARDKS